MIRCPFCTYTTSPSFTLDWHRAKYRFAKLIQKHPSTSLKSYSALSFWTLQHCSTELSSENDFDIGNHLQSYKPEVQSEQLEISQSPATHFDVVIEELASFLDSLVRWTVFHVGYQFIHFFHREHFKISVFRKGEEHFGLQANDYSEIPSSVSKQWFSGN